MLGTVCGRGNDGCGSDGRGGGGGVTVHSSVGVGVGADDSGVVVIFVVGADDAVAAADVSFFPSSMPSRCRYTPAFPAVGVIPAFLLPVSSRLFCRWDFTVFLLSNFVLPLPRSELCRYSAFGTVLRGQVKHSLGWTEEHANSVGKEYTLFFSSFNAVSLLLPFSET